jgi:hypothetical protein
MRRWRLAMMVAGLVLVGGGIALWLNVGPGDDDTSYADDAWEKVTPGGDCHCADGSEFAFWERRTDPSMVVLFLNGNGVCWDATSCALTSESAPGEGHGLFEFADFHDTDVNGTKLVDWLDALVTDEPPDDVHCDQCDP